MDLQDIAYVATVVAGVSAFVSAGAAAIIVFYTGKQLRAIERDYKETRHLDLTSKQVGADQVRELLDEWLIDTVQAKDQITQIMVDIDSGAEIELLQRVKDLIFARSDHDLFGAIDLSRISPIVAIQASRIYGTLSQISDEIVSLSDVYERRGDDQYNVEQLKTHLADIQQDLEKQEKSLNAAKAKATEFCSKMRTKAEELEQWLSNN